MRDSVYAIVRFIRFLVCCGVGGGAAFAQDVPTRLLTTPEAEFATPFTKIGSLRELSDGRVIIIDAQERLIQLVDFKARTIERVGRHRRGPGEYHWPDRGVTATGLSELR